MLKLHSLPSTLRYTLFSFTNSLLNFDPKFTGGKTILLVCVVGIWTF